MHEETFFNGGVFHKSIDGGRAGADLELVHDGVKAVTREMETVSWSGIPNASLRLVATTTAWCSVGMKIAA
jgi:hypothetical protein